ncbi:MAG: hypothetical protein WB630_14975 [Candidatus Acidiferrales bacterium]
MTRVLQGFCGQGCGNALDSAAISHTHRPCASAYPKLELALVSLYKLKVMVPRYRTRSTIRLAVVMALLFSGLALAEFPELLQLRDDTSNDFTVLVSGCEVSRDASTVKFVLKPTAMFAQYGGVEPAASALPNFLSSDLAAHSSVDYLHLLCVHRT